jgi:RNA polymerase sigma-70 factor (ECF subfamily)
MAPGPATDQPQFSGVAAPVFGNVKEDCLRRLMLRYQKEDRTAADRLVYRLARALTGYLYYCNVPQGDREDILQECWIRIHRSRHKYQDTRPVLPWVFAFMRHTRLDACRATRRRRSREIAMPILPERSAPPEALVNSEAQELLERLPESHRQILWMTKVEGLSVPEVAAALACSEGAVKQRAHRGYKRLRALLLSVDLHSGISPSFRSKNPNTPA